MIATVLHKEPMYCQNYTEQYKGAAAHTVTTRLQYAKVRDRWKMVVMREGERQVSKLQRTVPAQQTRQ
jgi:hypothetical protein